MYSGTANLVFAVAVLMLTSLGEGILQFNIMSRYYYLVDRGYVSHHQLEEISTPPSRGDWSAVPDYLTRDAFWVLERGGVGDCWFLFGEQPDLTLFVLLC